MKMKGKFHYTDDRRDWSYESLVIRHYAIYELPNGWCVEVLIGITR